MTSPTDKRTDSPELLSGIFAAAVTPMTEDGASLSLGSVGLLLNYLEADGLDGVLILGTTGEFPSLSHTEKIAMLAEAASTKGHLKMIVGCSSTSIPETLELCRSAEKRGADAALVAPPYYFRSATEKGLENYFARVLEETSLPVILYHIPMNTGIEISKSLIERLSRFKNLWGVKDTGGKLQETSRFLSNAPGRVLLGSDQLLASGLKLGVQGAITACANIAPRLLADLFHTFQSGQDYEIHQGRLSELKNSLGNTKLHSALKTILCARGIPVGSVRPPLLRLTSEEEEYARSVASNFQLI